MNQHKRRAGSVTAALVAALLALTACSTDGGDEGGGADEEGQPVRGGTLNMLGSGDIDYMDPNVSYYSIGYLVHRMWSRQLFANPAVEGQTTTPAPDLATEMPTTDNGGVSEDGLTYTIEIREGAQWDTSPPRQITAEDMVRGVKRTCNPVAPFGGLPNYLTLIEGFQDFCDGFADVEQTPAAVKEYVENTELPGVVATDERTVEFRLTHAATYFVDMLTLTAFTPAPVEVLDYLPGSQQLGQNQIASGPYRIESWSPTKSIVFTRNPSWDADTDPIRKAYVDRIVIDETVSEESAQQQLETGTANADLGFDNSPPVSRLPQLIAQDDPLLNLGPTDSTNPYIVFNFVSPNNDNALADVRVRQALEHAISRDNLIQVLGGPDINKPLTHVLPEGIEGSQDIDLYPYDTDQAEQLLSEAGYGDGMTLKLLYRPSSESNRKAFATLQQDLSKVGIRVTGVASPDADFYTKYLQVPDTARRGVWDLALAGWGPDWYGNAALSFFAPLFDGEAAFPPIGSNFGFYENPETSDLIERAATSTSLQESLDLWGQADRLVMEDAAFFPITDPLQSNYHAEHVHNAIYMPPFQQFDPTNVWLDADMQGG